MREVCIRKRPDGVTELSPALAPLDPSERWLVIATIAITSCGLFAAGLIPALVLAAVVASSLAGELVLGAKALLLVLSCPPAEVFEVPGPVHLRRAR